MVLLFLVEREIIVQAFTFLLGLVSDEIPSYAAIILFTVLLLYIFPFHALPNAHPGTMLTEAQDQVTDTRLWLEDEAAMRRSRRMYRVTANGCDSLRSVEQRVQILLSQHEKSFTFRNAFRYAAALPSLVIEARRCQSDITALLSNLKDQVR